MYNFDNIKILIVDDEELLREILSESFSMYGALVDSAEGGITALEKIQQNNYDLVITDLRMPLGDGLNLIENINKLQIPIPKLFVCSAYNDLTPEKISEMNILKIFVKPFDLNDLLISVFSFIAQKA